MHSQLVKRLAELSHKGDLDKAAKEIQSASRVLKAIESVASDRVEHFEMGVSEYTNPSWAYKQAHENGKKQMLKEVIVLLDTKP